MGKVIAAAAYSNGRKVADIKIDESSQWATRPDHFVWIGIEAPDEDDLRLLQAQFGLHELAIEDALHAHQRPKLETYDDTLFVVLKPARYIDSDEVVQAGEIHVFVSSSFVVAVRHGEASALKDARKRLE